MMVKGYALELEKKKENMFNLFCRSSTLEKSN